MEQREAATGTDCFHLWKQEVKRLTVGELRNTPILRSKTRRIEIKERNMIEWHIMDLIKKLDECEKRFKEVSELVMDPNLVKDAKKYNIWDFFATHHLRKLRGGRFLGKIASAK